MVGHNVAKVLSNGMPVAQIEATNEGTGSKQADDKAGGLANSIILSKHTKVHLTSNLWLSAGLTNGAAELLHIFCIKKDMHHQNYHLLLSFLLITTKDQVTCPIIQIQFQLCQSGEPGIKTYRKTNNVLGQCSHWCWDMPFQYINYKGQLMTK